MTLEGANSAMKRRNKSVKRDVSILERLQNIRAMLVEVRESLGDNSPIEYEAPIEAVAELISDVEEGTKAAVVAAVTTPEPEVEETPAEEPVAEPAPRRRGRPRKEPEVVNEDAQTEQPAVTRRRGRAKKNEEAKELFPFYEQSLF